MHIIYFDYAENILQPLDKVKRGMKRAVVFFKYLKQVILS